MNSSLDTNVILRYLMGDVPAQAKKVTQLLSDQSQTFYVPDLVVAEVIFNLQGAGATRQVIVETLNRFFEAKNVQANSMITDQVLPFYLEHPALSFVDCYVAFEADVRHAEPLWTFDKRLARQHPSAKQV